MKGKIMAKKCGQKGAMCGPNTWDLGSSVFFSIMVHNYPWDPGIWLSTLIKSIEENTFIRGMEC